MRKIIYAVLFFTFISFNSLIWAAEIDIPLPSGAIKTMEKSANIGPTTSTMQDYETSLSQDRIYAFYKKEMAKAGWSEVKQGLFSKGDYLAILAVSPVKTRNKLTQFSLATSRIPSKEEIMAQRKAVPDKLDFIPVYPKSEQVFLWEMPMGISASYETKSSIKEVVFFYKSAMLNYGWSLSEEAPITTETVNCPECEKVLAQLPKDAAKTNVPLTSSKASLIFRKGIGESCIIRFYQNADKTTILVTYTNANKRINS